MSKRKRDRFAHLRKGNKWDELGRMCKKCKRLLGVNIKGKYLFCPNCFKEWNIKKAGGKKWLK